jgi:hypothetical protein
LLLVDGELRKFTEATIVPVLELEDDVDDELDDELLDGVPGITLRAVL